MELTWTDAAGTVTSLTSAPFSVLQGVVGLDAIPTVNVWEARIGFDGSALSRSRSPERSVLLPIGVQADDVTADTRRLLATLGNGPGTLSAITDGVTRELTQVVLDAAVSDPRDSNNSMPWWRKLLVPLVAGDPWWYSELRSQFLNVGGVTTFDNASVDFDAAGTPFDGGDSTLVAVAGSVMASPLIVIDGPFTALTINNGATGEALVLAGALTASERLFIETAPGARGPRMDGGRVDWSLLTAESRLFGLTGATPLSVSSAGSTGDSKVEVRWRDRWATP